MSTETHTAPASAPPAWHMYRALVGVALVCGLLIVGVYELTAPIIAANRAEALERAIFEVLPQATSSASFKATATGFASAEDDTDGPLVHAGFDDAGSLVGVAIEAQGLGYQDIVKVLYGYSPAKKAIVGLVVLESRETPGLGDKVETDDRFRANFEALDVSLTSDGSALAHPIETVKPGTKVSPWQIDTITGATITSTAVAKMLRESSAERIPHVERHGVVLVKEAQ